MATMLIQMKVENFAKWKKVFDSRADVRASSGALSGQLYRDASEPNKLTLIFKWNSLENAKKYAESPGLKAAYEKADVGGTPVFSLLNEV
jgi:quinol monooxygenase YgiN